jgi:hypothetical protein
MGLLVTFSYGYYGGPHVEFFVPVDYVSRRFPFSLCVALATTLIAYRFPFNKATVLCPTCGHVKQEDSVRQCSCGGTYCDLCEYEWRERPVTGPHDQ